MKQIFLTILLAISSLSLFAQEQVAIKALDSYLSGVNKQIQVGLKNKDYQLTIELLTHAIDTIQNSSVRKAFSNYQASALYNLACCESILNNKEAALTALEKAIEGNYMGYQHALQDQDLDNIRQESRYELIMQKWRVKADFKYILKNDGGYNKQANLEFPQFTYLPATDSNLVRIREYFNLDSIAGNGDEISRIKNLLLWAHNIVRHDGNSSNPNKKNAIDIIEICQKEDRGVNCRMMAQMLNECYLAMGFKARYVTCLPKVYINDCHVINVVYSNTLDKWIWVDPTFNAYVTDENGTLLSIEEVRERLKTAQPLILNEDANWNNQNKQTKEYYLDQYMAKNLYYLQSPEATGYNTETNKNPRKITLVPTSELPKEQWIYSDLSTDDPNYFWQKPL